MKRCLIFTVGSIDLAFAEQFLRGRAYDRIVAADAGLLAVRALGLTPDEAVGDFDSLPVGVLEEYRSVPGICFEIHSPQKDETDTELALLAAERSGCAAADILGALGGRMDHAVGNIQLMYRFYGRGMDVSIYDPRNRLYLVGKRAYFRKKELYGRYISFLPMTESVEGLTLKGFQYPLDHKTICLGTSRCISNELAGEEGYLELERGVLLCVESHD